MRSILGSLVFCVMWASATVAQVWSFSQDAAQNIGSVDAVGQGGLQATFRCHIGAPQAVNSFVANAAHPGLITLMVHPSVVPDPNSEVRIDIDGVAHLQTRFQIATPENVPAIRLRADSPLIAALAQGSVLSLMHPLSQTTLPLQGADQFAVLSRFCAQAPAYATRAAPGFDCTRATTATERAICADIDLTLLDVALNDAMQQAIARIGDQRARGGQRAWVPRRDACGASKECLQNIISARIEKLRGQGKVTVQVPVRTTAPVQQAPKKTDDVTVTPTPKTPTITPAKTTKIVGLPPVAPLSDYDRNMKIARGAWEQIRGFNAPDRPDQRDIRDFSAVLLTDGSWVIPGLGVRLLSVKKPFGTGSRAFLEIIDMQEFSPIWAARNENIKIGGLIPVELFSIDSNLRTALSRSGRKKLNEGFSFPFNIAVPHTNRKNEPAYRIQSLRLRVPRQTRPHGRWLVAEPEQAPTDLNAELDLIVANARGAIKADPCGISNLAMLNIERELDLIRWEADAGVPNLRMERDTACAIARNGSYGLPELERLAVLRSGMCEDLEGGVLSPKITTLAESFLTRVPKGNYLTFARIGVFDFEKPERQKLTAAQGAERAVCITQYLEDALFR